MCLMIHCWICVRVDTGLGRIENVNVEMKHLLFYQTQIAVTDDFFFYIWTRAFICVCFYVQVTNGHVDPGSAQRWIEKLVPDRGCCPVPPLGCRLTICLLVCLSYSTGRVSTVHCLHTNLVFVSTCLRSTITLLFSSSFSRQSLLLCPSITFSYNLLWLSPPCIIFFFRFLLLLLLLKLTLEWNKSVF